MLTTPLPGSRITLNGDIIFYKRENINKYYDLLVKEGYEQSLFDESVFNLIYKVCKHHTQIKKITPCRKVKELEYCSLKSIQINPIICFNCSDRVF